MATLARNSNSKRRTNAAFSLGSRAWGPGRASTTGSPLPVPSQTASPNLFYSSICMSVFWHVVLSEYWLVSCLIPWCSETTLWGVWSSLTCQCWTLQFTLSSGWWCSSGGSCPEWTYWDSSETVGGRSQRQPPEQGEGLSYFSNMHLRTWHTHMCEEASAQGIFLRRIILALGKTTGR